MECYTKFIIWIIIIQSAVKKILYVNTIRISVSIRIIRPGYKSGSIRMKSGFFFCVIRMTVFIRIEALSPCQVQAVFVTRIVYFCYKYNWSKALNKINYYLKVGIIFYLFEFIKFIKAFLNFSIELSYTFNIYIFRFMKIKKRD